MDLGVMGVSQAEIEGIRASVVDSEGTSIATAYYSGQALLWMCAADGMMTLDNLPVPFDASETLEGLDGAQVTLRIELGSPDALAVERTLLLADVDY